MTCHNSGTKVCHRQGCVWLEQVYVQIKMTELKAVNIKQWSSSVSNCRLQNLGLGTGLCLDYWCATGETWEWHFLHYSSSSSATLQVQGPGDEERGGGNPDASFSSGITTFFLSKMHCNKCILNQVWTDSAAQHFELGASTHIGRGAAGRWDNKRTLQGLGANPNGYRVFWSPLCSHKTIVINLNIVSASSGGLCGGVVRKI